MRQSTAPVIVGAAPALVLLVALLASFATTRLAEAGDADPRNNYILQCQGCHMPDGSGSPGSVPDFRERLGLFLGVPGGREFLIRVPGSAQSPLSNTELAEVLNWMVREFGPAEVAAGFQPFSAAEIGLHRKPLSDVESVRRALLERIAGGTRDP